MSNHENEDSAPRIPIPERTEEEMRETMARPPSHNVGIGGALAILYRSLISDLTKGSWFTPPVMNKLMNDYLDVIGKDNPNFSRSNDRNNLLKALAARSHTWKSFCKLLIFAKFTNVRITIEGVREDGSKASSYIDIDFKPRLPGTSPDKEEDAEL